MVILEVLGSYRCFGRTVKCDVFLCEKLEFGINGYVKFFFSGRRFFVNSLLAHCYLIVTYSGVHAFYLKLTVN